MSAFYPNDTVPIATYNKCSKKKKKILLLKKSEKQPVLSPRIIVEHSQRSPVKLPTPSLNKKSILNATSHSYAYAW